MTTLKSQLHDDLTAAMRARDEVVVSTLRLVLSGVTTAEVAGDAAVELSDDQVRDVLRAEAKKRAEAADLYAGAGRDELAAKERSELAVIEHYLPPPVGDDELAAIVADEVARAAADGASGPKAMGPVVKAVRDRVGSGADGARIAALVRSALA
jgi:uncharacterized protein YqeY